MMNFAFDVGGNGLYDQQKAFHAAMARAKQYSSHGGFIPSD
jgi:hypothetical protein